MLAKPAKVPSLGARSGGVGNLASAGARKASVTPVDGKAASSAPDASLDAIGRGQRRALALDRPFELVAAARFFRGVCGGDAEQQQRDEQ